MSEPDGDLARVVVAHGRRDARTRLASSGTLAALRRAGTRHVYADTADVDALRPLAEAGDGALWTEIDGNTANQPLVRKVVERVLDAADAPAWDRDLTEHAGTLPEPLRHALLYAIVCGRVGVDMAHAFAAGRTWEVSLQLHMELGLDPEAARRVGVMLHRMVPSAFVKVPFRPDAPACFLVARDLERLGIPVNFTSTFSARQAVTAAMLADVARTNIFMGRLDQGLGTERLGEHVDLEAQRALRRLRREEGVRTQLIVASLHDWRSLVRVAGCDVFTVPCPVLEAFLAQREVAPDEIRDQRETSYADRLGLGGRALERLGEEGVARLYRVEPELVAFLAELRRRDDYRRLQDGDTLFHWFDRAGFGDLFHAPTPEDLREMRSGKLPDLDGKLVRRVPLDTHYSLLANADFAAHQEAIDAAIDERLRA